VTRAELALSASARAALSALRTGDGRVFVMDAGGDASPSTRGTDLVAHVDALCKRAGITLAELGAIRVDVGPGSYTGLRVAVTLARTLAAFGTVALSRFTSLELLASAAWQQRLVPDEHELVVVLDARRERFHTARLALRDGRCTLLTEPAALDQTALLTECSRESDRPTTILTQDSVLAHEALSTPLAAALPLPTLRAEDLFHSSLAATECAISDLSPLYLMATYAD
jgi:tRNA threonylcarbamoyl adenosine modification protein YeaZ